MSREPEYNRGEALTAAASLFGRIGYEGCSIGDLVRELKVHRGSLYNAFGSKRGLFLEALRHHIAGPVGELSAALAADSQGPVSGAARAAHSADLDLLLVASLEASADVEVRGMLADALGQLGRSWPAGRPPGSDASARSRGLTLLVCRLAERFLPPDELSHHLGYFSGLLG